MVARTTLAIAFLAVALVVTAGAVVLLVISLVNLNGMNNDGVQPTAAVTSTTSAAPATTNGNTNTGSTMTPTTGPTSTTTMSSTTSTMSTTRYTGPSTTSTTTTTGTATSTMSTTTGTGSTSTAAPPNCDPRTLLVDMEILFDESESFSQDQFKQVTTDVADNFVNRLDVGYTKTRLAVQKFAAQPNTVAELTRDDATNDMLTSIIKSMSLTMSMGTNNMALALQDPDTGVANAFRTGGDRDNAPNVLVIIAGRPPMNPTAAQMAAERIKSELGMNIFTVGYGSKVQDSDLAAISSGDGFHFSMSGYSDIQSIANTIFSKICSLQNTSG